MVNYMDGIFPTTDYDLNSLLMFRLFLIIAEIKNKYYIIIKWYCID